VNLADAITATARKPTDLRMRRGTATATGVTFDGGATVVEVTAWVNRPPAGGGVVALMQGGSVVGVGTD
jgi:hypothetical protein